MEYTFTQDWFNDSKMHIIWERVKVECNPKHILEIGSFEGQSSCFFIEKFSPKELYCLDPWESEYYENHNIKMDDAYKNFESNIKIALSKTDYKTDVIIYKNTSNKKLPELVADRYRNYFDLIYIDGSHIAHDVMFDATLSFELCKTNGLIIFDDYLWKHEQEDILSSHKLAIDSFTNLYSKKIEILSHLPLYKLFVKKLND